MNKILGSLLYVVVGLVAMAGEVLSRLAPELPPELHKDAEWVRGCLGLVAVRLEKMGNHLSGEIRQQSHTLPGDVSADSAGEALPEQLALKGITTHVQAESAPTLIQPQASTAAQLDAILAHLKAQGAGTPPPIQPAALAAVIDADKLPSWPTVPTPGHFQVVCQDGYTLDGRFMLRAVDQRMILVVDKTAANVLPEDLSKWHGDQSITRIPD